MFYPWQEIGNWFLENGITGDDKLSDAQVLALARALTKQGRPLKETSLEGNEKKFADKLHKSTVEKLTIKNLPELITPEGTWVEGFEGFTSVDLDQAYGHPKYLKEDAVAYKNKMAELALSEFQDLEEGLSELSLSPRPALHESTSTQLGEADAAANPFLPNAIAQQNPPDHSADLRARELALESGWAQLSRNQDALKDGYDQLRKVEASIKLQQSTLQSEQQLLHTDRSSLKKDLKTLSDSQNQLHRDQTSLIKSQQSLTKDQDQLRTDQDNIETRDRTLWQSQTKLSEDQLQLQTDKNTLWLNQQALHDGQVKLIEEKGSLNLKEIQLQQEQVRMKAYEGHLKAYDEKVKAFLRQTVEWGKCVKEEVEAGPQQMDLEALREMVASLPDEEDLKVLEEKWDDEEGDSTFASQV